MRPTLSAHNLDIEDFDFYTQSPTTHSSSKNENKLTNVDLDCVFNGKLAGSELHFRGTLKKNHVFYKYNRKREREREREKSTILILLL